MKENYTSQEARENLLSIIKQVNDNHKVVHVYTPDDPESGVRIIGDEDYQTITKALYLLWYGAKSDADPQYEETFARLKEFSSRTR